MSQNKWLEELKEGDKVIVTEGYWGDYCSRYRNQRHIETVSRFTKTTILIDTKTPFGETLTRKFSRESGLECKKTPEDRHDGILVEATQTVIDSIYERDKRDLLLETIHSKMLLTAKLPTATLERIAAIMDESEVTPS